MSISASSLAAATAMGVKNVQFKASAENLPRKIDVIGTFDPAKTGIAEEVPQLILSPEDAGSKYGLGSMLHRLLKAVFAGSNGVECWAIPQAEIGGAVAAAGDIVWAGAATEAGTICLYIGGDRITIPVASGDTNLVVATAVFNKINEVLELAALATNAVPGTTDIVSKSKGPWGDGINVSFNWGFEESLPAGLTAVVTALSGGAGVPDIQDALDGTGTGDLANEAFYTDTVHGYGQDSGTLDKLSIYNGVGNDFVGCYEKTVARPFRSLNGDTTDGASALTALLALGNGRKTDRTNGCVAVPGSPNHPAEIAAIAIGIAARINNDRAAQSCIGQILPGVIPGKHADNWCSEYDNRDTAVKAGISPTKVSGGAAYLQNLLTFYHPDSIPSSSNGYRSMRNVSIIQNILNSDMVNFDQEKWKGISIVADVLKVSSIKDRQKAKDKDAVMDDLVALTIDFEGKAWIFSAAFTLEKLASNPNDYIEIRPGGTGFNFIRPVLLSGEGGILDGVTEFDTSLAVLTA